MMKRKDDRWPKQFGDFAECLAMYVLGQLKNMSVALIDHAGADLIAAKRENTDVRYAISVKGRNFPVSESKSFKFDQNNIDKLSFTAETFGMDPAVAFVFVDEMEEEKKIRLFFLSLKDLREMSNDPDIRYLENVMDGINFKYTEGKTARHLSEIRKCDKIDYTELTFSVLNDTVSFIK